MSRFSDHLWDDTFHDELEGRPTRAEAEADYLELELLGKVGHGESHAAPQDLVIQPMTQFIDRSSVMGECRGCHRQRPLVYTGECIDCWEDTHA